MTFEQRPTARSRGVRPALPALSLLAGLAAAPAVLAQAPAPVEIAGEDGARVRIPAGLHQAGTEPATRRACPAGIPAGTTCLAGVDHLGAGYWLAMPADWNGVLVVHAHGGPELGKPRLERTEADLKRWSVFLRAGYAWAGSTFRQGGFEVRAAGEDTERARQAFVNEFGHPRRTLLHGQSWGAGVAARMAERYTTPDLHPRRGTASRRPYDAVLLTSGVLGGAPRSYDVRLDARVVYQAVCRNHPRPDEPAYPLWMGLPLPAVTAPPSHTEDAPDLGLSREELARRIDECTGLGRPAAERSPAQRQRLATLTGVLKIPESALTGHLNWATWHFHDLVWRKLRGRNPFGNEGVKYIGSPGGTEADAALNEQAARYKADPAALAELSADADPTGRIHVPVLTLHGQDDPVAFVELEQVFRSTMEAAGTAEQLLQLVTRDREHSYLSDAQYLAAAAALLEWVDSGRKPTPAEVAGRCSRLDARWEPAKGCRLLPDAVIRPLAERVPVRLR